MEQNATFSEDSQFLHHFLEFSSSDLSKSKIKQTISDQFFATQPHITETQVNQWIKESLPDHLLSGEALAKLIRDLNRPLEHTQIKEIIQKETKELCHELGFSYEAVIEMIHSKIVEIVAREEIIRKSDILALQEEVRIKIEQQQEKDLATLHNLMIRVGTFQENVTTVVEELEGLNSKAGKFSDDLGHVEQRLRLAQQQLNDHNIVTDKQELIHIIRSAVTKSLAENQRPEFNQNLAAEKIAEQIAVFSADRIGLADFACGSAGGLVVHASSRIPLNDATNAFFTNNATFIDAVPALYREEFQAQKKARALIDPHETPENIPLPQPQRKAPFQNLRDFFFKTPDNQEGPEMILNPSLSVGHCWGFPGMKAHVVVKLACPVVVTDISIDHAHITNLLHGTGSIPSQYEVFGWHLDKTGKVLVNPVSLLRSTYKIEQGQIQTKAVQNPQKEVFQYVSLQVYSNHGASWTCLYRFRVHAQDQTCHKISA